MVTLISLITKKIFLTKVKTIFLLITVTQMCVSSNDIFKVNIIQGQKEKKSPQIKIEGSIIGIRGLCKKLYIPTLPPKSPMSGVTFHSQTTTSKIFSDLDILLFLSYVVVSFTP